MCVYVCVRARALTEKDLLLSHQRWGGGGQKESKCHCLSISAKARTLSFVLFCFFVRARRGAVAASCHKVAVSPPRCLSFDQSDTWASIVWNATPNGIRRWAHVRFLIVVKHFGEMFEKSLRFNRSNERPPPRPLQAARLMNLKTCDSMALYFSSAEKWDLEAL